MKTLLKLFSAFLVLAMLIAPTGWAATGDSNFTNVVASGDALFETSLYAEGGKSGASTVSSSSTNIAPTTLPYRWIGKYVGGSADGTGLDATNGGTRLPDGTDGQVLTLQVVGLTTGGSWVITPRTTTGFTSVTLDAIGEFVTLTWQDDTFHGATMGWIITATNGAVSIVAADLPGK